MTEKNRENTAAEICEDHTDDANALFLLGTRYSTGRDVQQDLVAAHKWFNLAAMMGHDEARQSRAGLAGEMSAAQIAEAQRQARAWLWSGSAKTAEEAPAKPVTPIANAPRPAPAHDNRHAGQQRASLCA
jgi:TPR repeat protein